MRTRIGLSLFVLSLFSALGTAAQTRGDITGVISDPGGTPLPGVAVSLSGPERRNTTTNDRGEFAFRHLLPGTYEVHVAVTGFAAVAQKVVLRNGANENLHVRLHAATLQENAAAAPAVPETKGAILGAGVGGGAVGGIYRGAPGVAPSGPPYSCCYNAPFNTEAYDHLDENPFRRVTADPLSTFSIDVDTASYANVRRFLNEGTVPPPGAVRIEELINYFRFNYPQPAADQPFSITTELAECPWNPAHRLALIGLQGREIPEKELPPRNLVFLIDVSGSMMPPDKLPLV